MSSGIGVAPEEAGRDWPPWLRGRRFALVVLSVVLATNVPYLYRLAVTPPGARMLGSNFRNLGDIYTYVAWMKQAAQGHLLFIMLYDPAPQPRVLFLPLFLVLGLLARWLSLDLMLVLQLARVVASVLLLLAARRFVRWAPPGQRSVAFVLLALATGLPGIFPEACPISSMFDSPLAAVAWTPILLAGDAWLACLVGGGRGALATGAWGAVLLLVHPYDAVSLTAMVAVTASYAALRIVSPGRAIRLVTLVALGMLPAAACVAYSILANPELRSWAATPRTSVLWQFLSFGTLPLLALAGVLSGRRRGEGGATPLLALWLVSSVALVILPVPSQRRYIQGLMAPLALLAARGHAALKGAGWRRPAGYLVAASFAGGIVMITLDMFLPATKAEAAGIRGIYQAVIPRYIPEVVVDDLSALEELPDGLVMAPETLDFFVPPFSGRQVFAGHVDQTPSYRERVALFGDVVAGRIGGEELARRGVRYVLADAWSPLQAPRGLVELRRSSRTILYEVEPAIWESSTRANTRATGSS